MKRYLFLLFCAAFFVLPGCASHYYLVKGEIVHIYLKSPTARTVYFASSLDGFERHEAKKIDDTWEITIPASREFKYFYIVDGVVYLPPCRLKEQDDFGSENCVYSSHM